MGGDSQLQQLYKSDRNPAQESQFDQLLTSSGIQHTYSGAKVTDVMGNGAGGNGADASFLTPQNAAGQKATTDAQNNHNNLVSSNTKSVTNFLGNFKNDVTNAQTTENNKFNVPQFENLVTGLNSRISDLATNSSNSGGGTVGNTGAGGFSNANQVDTAISSKYLPQLNTAESNLGTAATLAAQNVNQDIAPDQAYEQLLATNITTAMQGLTATQGQTLQYLLGQLENGTQLTETQMQVGEQYAQTVLNNATSVTLQNLKNQFTGIPSGQVTINPSTGQIVNPYLLATSRGGVYP